MQLIPTVDAAQLASTFPPVQVGDKAIHEDAIAAEMQYHSAENLELAWHEAARSLVIRELLLEQADELNIDASLAEEDRIAQLIDQALEVPEPDEAACQRFFEANPGHFMTPTLLAVSHILLAAAPDDVQARTEQEEVGRGLLERLTGRPQLFNELARDCSVCESRHQGGSLGQVSRGQTVNEFERVIWRLPEGIHPHLVESRYGWHIVRIDKRMDGRALSFEQVKPRTRQYLLEQVTRRALRQYIQVLAAERGVAGVDLELPDSPLMQ